MTEVRISISTLGIWSHEEKRARGNAEELKTGGLNERTKTKMFGISQE